MSFWMLVVLAFGLSADAFAVSVANGICYTKAPMKTALQCGFFFGLFQALMPLIGFLAGYSFTHIIENIDHWVALILLGVIGGRMIYGAIREMRAKKEVAYDGPRECSTQTLVVQAFATSIDALAVGVGLGVIEVNVVAAVSLIGAITFCCSFAGVFIGRFFGGGLSEKAELLGGIILVLIGLNIFIEHTGLLFYA